MKRRSRILYFLGALALCLVAACGLARIESVHAQINISPGTGVVLLTPGAGTTVSNCPPVSSVTANTQCIAASGAFAANGAAWVAPSAAPTATSISLTINGTTKTCTAMPCSLTFTVGAAATSPAITINSTAPTATSSAPALTVTAQ